MDAIALLREDLATMLAESSLQPIEAPDQAFPPVDVSPRACKVRAILRVADMYGWHSAITHFLELRNSQYLSDLTEPQLDDLKDRMDGYVDAASMGCSLADCLPAN